MSNKNNKDLKNDFSDTAKKDQKKETPLIRGIDYDLDSSSMRLSERAQKVLMGK